LDDILETMGKEDDDDTLIALAQDDLGYGKFGLAAVAVERVSERSPDNGEAAKLLAKIMFRWAEKYEGANQPGRYERAIEAATQAQANGVDDAETYLLIGRAHLGLNQDAAAVVFLEQARARQANDPAILFDLGKAYLRVGDLDAALDSYQAAIVAADQLASRAERNQRLIEAIGDVLTAPTDSPDSALALASMLVDAVLADDETEFANAEAYFNTGEVMTNDLEIVKKQRYANAIPYFVRALSLDPMNPDYWTPLRTALIVGLDMGQVESAEAALTVILGASDGQGVEPLIDVADSELSRNTFGLAAAALERALSIEPDNEEAYTRLVETYYRWGARHAVRKRHEQAMETADRAIAAGMENSDIYYYKGRALMALGRYDESVDALAMAANLAPYDPDIFSRLGWAAYRAGQYERSAEASGRATELRPDDPRGYFNQGLAYVALGNAEAAADSYQAGVDVANALENADKRADRLNEAIGDLKSVQDDPADLAGQFIGMLEAALTESAP
jgi:tetratricopeptide (TPR) repeat protein